MAVLFDLDGTLVGPRRSKNEVRNECADKIGAPDLTSEEYYDAFRDVVRNSKVDTRAPVFEKIFGDPELAEKMSENYRRMILDELFVYPDVEEVLQSIDSQTGLVTNGPKLVQRQKLRRFGLRKYFDVVKISGELGFSKPGPEIFEFALRDLDSSPKNSLYVGNSPDLDVAGARNAGLTSVLIVRGDDPSGPEPHYEIKDMRELYEIIDEVEGSGA